MVEIDEKAERKKAEAKEGGNGGKERGMGDVARRNKKLQARKGR